MFAFVYRAYRKDEKLNQMWQSSGADGIPLSDVAEFGDSCDSCEGGGGVRPPLLSLQSVCVCVCVCVCLYLCCEDLYTCMCLL